MTEQTTFTYTVLRSRRRTLSMEIKNGELLVRAPLHCSQRQIEQFLAGHRKWIATHLTKAMRSREEASAQGLLTESEIRELARQAKAAIPERVRYYAPRIGVTYGRITMRCQKTRWGSCSSKGNLNFNCLLMLTPPEVLDSVVVHELCHRKEMNHSQRFYAEVLKVYPEYFRYHNWLKQHGEALLARVAGR